MNQTRVHPRASGGPEVFENALDSRWRGNDELLLFMILCSVIHSMVNRVAQTTGLHPSEAVQGWYILKEYHFLWQSRPL